MIVKAFDDTYLNKIIRITYNAPASPEFFSQPYIGDTVEIVSTTAKPSKGLITEDILKLSYVALIVEPYSIIKEVERDFIKAFDSDYLYLFVNKSEWRECLPGKYQLLVAAVGLPRFKDM